MWTQVVFASELQAADGRSDEVVSRFGHAAALYEAQSSVLYTSIGGWSANLTYRVTNEVLVRCLVACVYDALISPLRPPRH